MLITIKERAKGLPLSTKKEIVQSYIGKETLFHHKLKTLFERIHPNAHIYILQGNEEKGKDLVIREKKRSFIIPCHLQIIL